MSAIDVSPMKNNTVAYLSRMRDQIQLDPPYQRQGAVWSQDKKRLLIDSLLNDFDIPKIYLHEHATPIEIEGRRVRYSLVDGRQRLEAIWDFVDGNLALDEDFILLQSGSSVPAGKTFPELEEADDFLAATLMATSLDVRVIKTDDIDLIEEMFTRLNEAVPLNAAEKRNGRGGALRDVVSDLVGHVFFASKLPFDNRRFRQYDLALKFLLWTSAGKPVDAKKRQLDAFWDANRSEQAEMEDLSGRVKDVLDAMAPTFENDDKLLTSVGMASLYFLTFEHRHRDDAELPDRSLLLAFNRARDLEAYESEDNLSSEQRDYLEFDSLAQRQTDGYALDFRLRVLDRFIDNAL